VEKSSDLMFRAQFDQLPSLQKSILQILNPEYLERVIKHQENGARFSHYTSLSNALNILRSRQFWMRKATLLNDYTEMQYGSDILFDCYRSEKGKHFRNLMLQKFSDEWEKFEQTFNYWHDEMKSDTYIACFSEHSDTEDNIGRLSMWRAYGGSNGVALILNPDPFHSDMDNLGPWTVPIQYTSPDNFSDQFFKMCDGLEGIVSDIDDENRQPFINAIFEKFRSLSVAVKHVGFHEEREWRIIFSPKLDSPHSIESKVEVINGLPQRVCKINLKNDDAKGIKGIEIHELINRIVIGPTEFSREVKEALCDELSDHNILNPGKMVIASDIPLR
jgi:Protein of unknown function (DUF2971)